MHYKDGTEVKIGDVFKKVEHHGAQTITTFGVVATKSPDHATCNLGYIPLISRTEEGDQRHTQSLQFQVSAWSATASDCEKVA
jgi:hypothetical protein